MPRAEVAVPTILVVDDRPEGREPIAKLLRREGYSVVTAANAIEAMAACRKDRPDLMLLDVMIPPMDGLTFLSLLRDDPETHDLPVVLVTGLADSNTISQAHTLNVKDYLVKAQFTFDQLLDVVRKHVGPSQKNSKT